MRARASAKAALASSARLAVADNAASGASLDGGYSPPAGTRNVESVVIDGETGQITVAFTTRVAAAGTNTLVLVPSAPDKADAPTARVPLKGRDAGRRDRVECFAAGKGRRRCPRRGRAAAARRGDAAREVCAGGVSRLVPVVVQGGAGSMPAASSAGRGGRAVSGRGAKAPHRGESFV